MGRVHQIVVENFKSYKGRVDIGPFRKFTCIIGPNGAGKSNLMDAISFVLGVQARQLRSEKLRDLVYRMEGEDPKKNERTAFVELTYLNDASEDSGGLVFKRLILRGGEARFQVNGSTLSQAEYMKCLESINILSKVRNFLVFQGDVEATAQRQGKDLTTFFEQVSGSEHHRQEYERLAAEKAKKEDDARYLFTKKRNAVNEKKRVVQQKDEADEYRRLEAERRTLQREFFLFRLHGVAKQLEEIGNVREQAHKARDGLQNDINTDKRNIDEADRARAQSHLTTMQADRALNSTRSRFDRISPELVAARSKIGFLQRRLEDIRKNREKDDHKKAELQSQLTKLQEEQTKLEQAEQDLANQLAEKELRFTPEQRKEFDRAKQEAERVTAASSDGLRQLEHQVRNVSAERLRAERDMRESQARCDHLRRRVSELTEAVSTSRSEHESHTTRATNQLSELQRLRANVADFKEEKDQLKSERQQLMDTIQDISASERQLEHDREIAKICASLAGSIPGVSGRVVDLCRPSQKRLHVAVNVALGKFLDAVVVDTSETARKCVRHLKEHRLAPMTFLPLNDLRASPPDPRLQELVHGQRALRLGINCISFDESHSRAFEFLLGDVVIADTMTDGRRFAFGDAKAVGVSAKVVTIAGEAIAKNGNLSVNSDATREGATRFDITELESTKGRLEAIDRRLHEMHAAESSGGVNVTSLEGEVRRLEAKSVEAEARLKSCQDQLNTKVEELRQSEAALEALTPQVSRLVGEESKVRDEQRHFEEHVGNKVSGYFKRLSADMGVDDVRKVEREWRHEKEIAEARGDELARQLRNVRAEVCMLEESLSEFKPGVANAQVPKLQQELQQLQEKEASMAAAAEEFTVEIRGLEEKLRESTLEERDKDRILSRLRQESKEKRQRLMAAEKRIADMGSEEQTLMDAREDILRQSVLEDVEIPLLRGGFSALQDLPEEPRQHRCEPGSKAATVMDNTAAILIDFGSLPAEKQAASSGPAAKMLEEEYRSEIERLRVELKRRSPNLKAISQMQGVMDNVQNVSLEADVARREIEEIEAQFEAVRKSRRAKFTDCFDKVATAISGIYQKLTANTAGLHADGGSAYLDLEDTQEPYNGGIKFTAMPPAKRFRDMHLLSGGEKTLAAMALLFAVHSYQKPPFMVLDEVDAALDANNVRALAAYVEQTDCQTIVISLKDRFFVRSEALVGVWKNKPEETSGVLTLDLTKYLPGDAQ